MAVSQPGDASGLMVKAGNRTCQTTVRANCARARSTALAKVTGGIANSG